MKPFRFCPSCSTELERADDGEGSACPNCGRTWYRASSPTVGCVIVRDDRALISKRGKEPEKGRFDVPGGFLHAGEEVIDGLKRELREELGVEVDVSIADCVNMAVHRYGANGDYVLALGFAGHLALGEPTADDDVDELRWVSLDEVDEIDFAWEHDRDLVATVLARATEEGTA